MKNKIIKSIEEITESPTDSILPAFMNIKPQVEEISQISAEILELKQLIMNQLNINSEVKPKRKMTSELLIEASKDANHLYFNDGWDMNDIKNHLVEKYQLSSYTADDILHRAI